MAVNFSWIASSLLFSILLSTISVKAQRAEDEEFTCKTYGRYTDPADCKSYYECFPSLTNGRLSAKKQKCPPGKGFHEKLMKCVSLKKLKGCSSRQARYEIMDETLNPLCQPQGELFVCADCKTLIHCINGNAYVQKCSTGFSCAEKTSFDSGVCHLTSNVTSCSCSGVSNVTIPYNPDPYDNAKFFSCENNNSTPEFFECPINREFNYDMQKCASENNLPSCTAEGVFSDPQNCTKYFSCLLTIDGWLQKSYECGPNQMFNKANQGCEDPCGWQSGGFECTEEGRFTNPTDCRTFYVCLKQADGSFITKTRRCPYLHYWTAIDATSGQCTNDPSECSSIKSSKCVVPSGWCNTSGDSEISSSTSDGASQSTLDGASSSTPDGASDSTTNNTSQSTSDGTSGSTPDGASGSTPDGASDSTTNGTSQSTSDGASSSTPDGASDSTTNNTSQSTSDGTSGSTPDGASDSTTNNTSQSTSDGTSGSTPDGASDSTTNDTSQSTSDGASGSTPDGALDSTTNSTSQSTSDGTSSSTSDGTSNSTSDGATDSTTDIISESTLDSNSNPTTDIPAEFVTATENTSELTTFDPSVSTVQNTIEFTTFDPSFTTVENTFESTPAQTLDLAEFRTGSENYKKTDPLAFIRNMLNRP